MRESYPSRWHTSVTILKDHHVTDRTIEKLENNLMHLDSHEAGLAILAARDFYA